ncbi:MAG: hypothetical protein GYA46_13615 [candidate division Zixibacteria bacterium]|nr:hypothetical protein [candidate division Zixibacteria bacterium]
MKEDVDRLYEMIERLKGICCQRFAISNWMDLTLEHCHGRQPYWKECRRGIYLFFDPYEMRSDGVTHRVVRVGTHSIKNGVGFATLWGRLKQHKGNEAGGGSHWCSIFRDLVGTALGNRDHNAPECWTDPSVIYKEVKEIEIPHEKRVSEYIRPLPFVIIKVDPHPDPDNHRKYLETNLIALLSNFNGRVATPACTDEPSATWLGRYAGNPKVVESGMWNSMDIKTHYDPDFFNLLEHYIDRT